MGLKITTQTNEQECGVCALTSLHNYYYKDKLEKEQVLDKSCINPTGMTIFDFETLGQTIGIECESYEVQWAEFLELKIKNYFVALVSTRDGQANHYVIVKKSKKNFIVFDSCSYEQKQLNYNQFKNVFLNVIILVSKKPNKLFNKVFSNTKTLLLFDLKFVLINLLLSVLMLCASIASASLLNWIIDSAISVSSLTNLLTISFIFVFIYFSNDLLTYISCLYVSKQLKTYYILFTSKILSSIEYKKKDFLNKVDRNWIFKIDECVYNISNFCVLEVNKLITNLIFSFICICIVSSIQIYMLIFVLLFALIEFVPFLFSYRKKKELFVKVVRNENKNSVHYKNLIQNLSFETWQSKRKTIIENIKNNYSKIYKNFNDVAIYKSNNELVKSLIKSITEIALISVCAYLVIKHHNLSIGRLTFIVAAFNLYKNSVNEIFNYYLTKIEFDVYWQVYKDITNVGNLTAQQFKNSDVKQIEFVVDNKTYLLDTAKKHNCVGLPMQYLIKNCSVIKVNNKNVDIESKMFFDQIIIVDQYANVNLDLFINLLNKQPTLYANYLKDFNIDINQEQISFYNQIILNLLCLIEEKNKIIIIDCLLNFIKPSDKLLVREILNKIRKNNFIFVIGEVDND